MAEMLAQVQADPDKLPELGSLFHGHDLYRLEVVLDHPPFGGLVMPLMDSCPLVRRADSLQLS